MAIEFPVSNRDRRDHPSFLLLRPRRNDTIPTFQHGQDNSRTIRSFSDRADSGDIALLPRPPLEHSSRFLEGAPYVGTTIYGLGATEMGIYIGLPALGYMVGNFNFRSIKHKGGNKPHDCRGVLGWRCWIELANRSCLARRQQPVHSIRIDDFPRRRQRNGHAECDGGNAVSAPASCGNSFRHRGSNYDRRGIPACPHLLARY